MKYTILSYMRSSNVGDALQSIALGRLLENVDFVERKEQKDFLCVADNQLVTNGYQCFPLSEDKTVFYAGIYLWSKRFNALAGYIRGNTRIVGARDPFTYSGLKRLGIPVELCGCVTTTLPRYDGPREGDYEISIGEQHREVWIHKDASWQEQCDKALSNLEFYKTAKSITTDKLHVALPCLSMGTPVKIPYSTLQHIDCPERLTLLNEMGFRYDKFNEIDMTPFADRYKRFLFGNL